MIEIEKPKIECVEDPANGTDGKFTVEPLERGYGITLGNALRRIFAVSRAGKIKNHVEPSVPVDFLPVERRRAEKSDPRGAKSSGRFHYISRAEYAQEKPGSIFRNTLAILPKFR